MLDTDSKHQLIAEWVKSATSDTIELREYQIEAWSKLWNRRTEGKHHRALMHLATGLGKTSVAAVDALHYITEENPHSRVLFVSHMNDISNQAKATFLRVNPQFSTAMFTSHTIHKKVDVTFATFQGLYRNLDRIDADFYQYIIWDEAHHIEAETFSAVRQHFTPEFELGLTATPERADGLDIINYFGKPIYTKSMASGIAEGWLSTVDYHIVFDDAIKQAMNNNFELSTLKQIRELFAVKTRNEVIAKNVLERRHTVGMDYAKTIVFCQNTAAAEEMASLLGGEAYHSAIKPEIRTDILKRFRAGSLQVICTVDMFNEGIDIPDARLVVFLRSTSSRTIFEQQLGRGLRKSEGKNLVMVLDFVANVERINFVRDLGHTISKLRGSGQSYLGFNTGRTGETTDTIMPVQNPYFGISNFEFEDKSIELLERYRELKNAEKLNTEQVVKLYHDTGSVQKTANILEVNRSTIKKHLTKAGVNVASHYKQLDIHTIAKEYYKLKSANPLAIKYGVSKTTILDRLHKAGYKSLPKPPPKHTDQELLDAYNKNSQSVYATAKALNITRRPLRDRLRKMGISTSHKAK